MIRLIPIMLMSMLLMSCNHLFYYPTSKVYYDFSSFPHKAHEFYLSSSYDETKLHGVKISGRTKDFSEKKEKSMHPILKKIYETKEKRNIFKGKTLLLYIHGNAENISSHFWNVAWIIPFGIDVLIIDPRGFGQSEGSVHHENIGRDMSDILSWAIKEKKEKSYENLVVFGQSLGGTLLLKAIEREKMIKAVDLIFIDSSFLSYKEMTKEKIKETFLLWPLFPFYKILISDEESPQKKNFISKENLPFLLVSHGREDEIVPYHLGEKLFHFYPAEKIMWPIEEGNHIDIFMKHQDKYRWDFIYLLEEKLIFKNNH